MIITIDRKWKQSTYTIGNLYIDNKFLCNSLEDKDRNLKDSMSEIEIKSKKVYGETAIPTGTYKLELTTSPKFSTRVWGKKYNGKVPLLKDVKGYSGVRIHPGNSASDLLGCIAVGRNLKKGMVLESTKWYYTLMDNYIIPAIKKGDNILVTVK